MGQATVILTNGETRDRVVGWVRKAPTNTRVTFKGPKRSLDQNSLLWARLTEIARQLPWHGVKLTADDWKLLFLDSLKHELRLAPNLNGTGFVNLGRSSSDLSKEEFGDLLELIAAFGAEHGVVFNEPVAA